MKPFPFGLIAQLAKTRIHLPLIHIETRFRITGDVVAVEMDQVFEQNAREPLDVTYTFPLPGSAAVHRCEMVVNGRIIRAVVMEEHDARRTVAEKKAAGHRTALVEVDRENLFTLQLGNVTPGDRIVIRFAYIEKLDRLGSQLSLRIPFSPGIRYIPGKPLLRTNRGIGGVDDTDQVPDASRLTPPRISGDHPDAATMYLHGLLDAADVDLRTLSSPTHPSVLRSTAGHIEVELAGEENLPDRDFVLRWEEAKVEVPQPRTWATTHDGHTYALLQLRAPEASGVTTRDDFTQDIYFLLDRSGSMSGMKWEKCAVALHAFVRELGPQDRIWITCFESDHQDFAEKPMLRDDLLADGGFQGLAGIGTAGGTELLPALEHVLRVRHANSNGRTSRIVLITDGQVGNEPQILTRMKKPDAVQLPVHCFGIDDAVNDAFLKSLARQSGGRCALMTPNDDIPAAVKRLAQALRRPVLTNLILQDGLLSTDDTAQLPDLHAGEVTLVAVRASGVINEAGVTASLPDGTPWTHRVKIESTPDTEAPRPLWARRRCRHLISLGKQNEAVQIAIAHNMVCDGTSFVAWDEAEKVTVAKRVVYQPSMESSVDYCASAPSPGAPPPRAAKAAALRFSRSPGGSMNFYESKVTHYQKRMMLQECSDEELVAPLKPPTKEELAARDIFSRYGRPESITGERLKTWAKRFHARIVALGLNHEVTDAIAVILHSWATEQISQSRDALLEELLATLTKDKKPVERLRQFVSDHVMGRHLEDLDRLLGAVC